MSLTPLLPLFQIWRVNTKYNLLYVHGSVPGHRNCLLKVKITHTHTHVHTDDTHLGVKQEVDVTRDGLIVLTETGDLAPV